MIINLTPHVVTLYDEDDNFRQEFLPAEEGPLRLETHELGMTVVDGIMVSLVGYGDMGSAPAAKRDVYYLVSLPLALSVRRADFLVPYNEVRDEDGRIIGCRSLAKVL